MIIPFDDRQDSERIFVTDGDDGSVRFYDGETYQETARIPLRKVADSVGFAISRKYLYLRNGGGRAGQHYSMLSAIDTGTNSEFADIRIDGDSLSAMALDSYRPHTYVNNRATNQVVVVDRLKNTIINRWPLTLGRQSVAMAIDEQRQRLFIGCRSGQIVILDSNTAKHRAPGD